MADIYSATPPQPSDPDELSLRDLILQILEYGRALRRYWWIIALCMIPCTAWLGYKAFSKPVTYTAGLTFMLNDDKGGTGLASILGQFGGLLGSSGSDYQLEKILEIARSRRIISTALFEKYNLNGREDFFANHLIQVARLHEKWQKDSTLRGFLFKTGDPVTFNRTENKALLALYGEMIGGEGVSRPLFGTGLNENTGIMTLSLSTRDEMLSIDLLNALYANISAFYIEKSIQRERETLAILEQKRDSIGRALHSNDYAAAAFDEKNRALLMETTKVPGTRYRRNTQLLTAMYGEAIKNAELAEFALKSNTPFLTLIDVPIPPLKPDPRGRLNALFKGLVLGFLLGAGGIIGKRIFSNIMSDKRT